jgi:hypothetical protein
MNRIGAAFEAIVKLYCSRRYYRRFGETPLSSQVTLDSIELDVELLEAVPLGPHQPQDARRSYPLPLLRRTGQRQRTLFRTILIDNPFLQVTILPDLGGRIAQILDKRTGREIFPFRETVTLEDGGPRMARLPLGLRLRASEVDLNELGPVEFQLHEADDDSAIAGVWLFDPGIGSGITTHCFIGLPPDKANVLLEVRCQNRTLWPQPYQVRFELGELLPETILTIQTDESPPGGGQDFVVPLTLGPRQMDSWSAVVAPFSGLGNHPVANSELGILFEGGQIRIQSAARRSGHKLVLLTQDGQSLEAPLDLHPERIVELPLAGLPAPPVEAVVLDERKEEILRHRIGELPRAEAIAPVVSEPSGSLRLYESALGELLASSGRTAADEKRLVCTLQAAGFSLEVRAASLVLQAMIALRRRDFEAAASLLEDALLYNAEDPLAWWLKAVAHRLAGGEDAEERPELPNAHYLAPLDPVLRAESFLAQNVQSKEKSPLIVPIADNPDALVDVAVLLHEAGLREELSRWVDECLRHREIPMLRYLLADALLLGSRMQVEAAQHVQAASHTPINPPYPWRRTERLVLQGLHQAFPDDARIAELLRLMEWGSR